MTAMRPPRRRGVARDDLGRARRSAPRAPPPPAAPRAWRRRSRRWARRAAPRRRERVQPEEAGGGQEAERDEEQAAVAAARGASPVARRGSRRRSTCRARARSGWGGAPSARRLGRGEQDREAREREGHQRGPRDDPHAVLGHGGILAHGPTPSGTPSPAQGVELAVVGRPPHNEAALIARAQAGDSVAYGSLVRAHQDIAFRVACLGGSAADAEEAAQEAFVKAWRALPRSAPARRSGRGCCDRRQRGAQPPPRRRAPRGAGPARGRAAERAEGSGARRRRRWCWPARAARRCSPPSRRCDERDRSVLTCRYLLELSEEETAAALGCRRGTVKSRTSRALERLRAHEGVEEVGAP